jgi:flagellar hook-length control protein FliK
VGTTAAPVPAGDTALVEHAAEVLRQIRLALNPSARRVVVELSPDELGRLTIKMSIHDGRVSAVVRAESPQTLELLERHLPELRAALTEGGVDAGDIDLQLASDGRSREHSPSLRHTTPATHHSIASTSDESETGEPVSRLHPRTPVDGSVDTYA